MKKKLLYLFIILASFGIASCSSSSDTEPPVDYNIEIYPLFQELVVGETLDLKSEITPTPESELTIKWKSSNPEIASVDQTGHVEAITKGQAEITATLENGKSDKATIRVVEEDKTIYKIRTAASLDQQLFLDWTFQITTSISPALPEGEEFEFKYRSENPEIISVNEKGLVTGLKEGESNIVVYVESDKFEIEELEFNFTVYINTYLGYKYRVYLNDKQGAEHTIGNPQAFLSQASIERRTKQGINIDETDLPIPQTYLTQLKEQGCYIATSSKWMNTVVVHVNSSKAITRIESLPFVEKTELVWLVGVAATSNTYTDNSFFMNSKFPHTSAGITRGISEETHEYYGAGWETVSVLNLQYLHDAGYMGDGMNIAVIDAGFRNLEKLDMFNNLKLHDTKSYVFNSDDITSANVHKHGSEVLSVLGANKPGSFVGTAPEANYWLLRSEDDPTEFPVEEDYWIAALEHADSAGVYLVNTSLNYYDYQSPAKSYTRQDADGKTIFMTRGANMGANKGMVLVNCAANRMPPENWVPTPADSEYVIAVGSIDNEFNIAANSARGTTPDGRIKPDVVARGAEAYVVNTANGTPVRSSGTSYASPAICGAAACLWEAFPGLTWKGVIECIKNSGDRAANPDDTFGWGIPDMRKAVELAEAKTGTTFQPKN